MAMGSVSNQDVTYATKTHVAQMHTKPRCVTEKHNNNNRHLPAKYDKSSKMVVTLSQEDPTNLRWPIHVIQRPKKLAVDPPRFVYCAADSLLK